MTTTTDDPHGAKAFADWLSEHRGAEGTEWHRSSSWDGTQLDDRQQRYLDAVLAGEIQNVAEADQGVRNVELNKSAFRLGQWIAGAGLDHAVAEEQLLGAAIACGLADDDGMYSVEKTIASGISAGMEYPRSVPPAGEQLPPEWRRNGFRRNAGDDEQRVTDDEQQQAQQAVRETFFGDKGGLLVLTLAEAVMREVRCGYNDLTERFYVYGNGVWTPNVSRIEAEIGRLLGDAYRKSHGANTLDMIRFSDTTLRITSDPLPDYINTPSGMVNWRTGERLDHSPDYLSTLQLPVDYDATATCPAFETFLTEVLPPDCYKPTEDSPGFIWELIGYAMYSGNPLHVAILLHGIGRNGKGTLIRVLKALLGAHNTSAVGLHDLTENRFRAATLYGKLANLAGDLDAKWIENTAAFKAITGGDTIQAEHKFGAAFDFTPWALPIYSANKPFGSADSSEGWHARWVIVPFPHSFLEEPDRGLDARLHTDAELQGIMRRGIEALPVLMARGRLPEPESVVMAKKTFVSASDAVRAWIEESCDTEYPRAWTSRTALYQAYRAHTTLDGSKTLSAREFYNRVGQIKGIVPCKNVTQGFKGVKVREQP